MSQCQQYRPQIWFIQYVLKKTLNAYVCPSVESLTLLHVTFSQRLGKRVVSNEPIYDRGGRMLL